MKHFSNLLKCSRAFFFALLIFISSLAFADGTFKIDVATNGGSGRARVLSPAELALSGGKASVKIIWSSANYDYMILGGKKYLNENSGGKSSFTLPLSLSSAQIKNLEDGNIDKVSFTLKVRADTIAMGRPHEIDYELVFGRNGESARHDGESVSLRDRKTTKESVKKIAASPAITVGNFALTKTGSLPLSYAKEFSVDFYDDVRHSERSEESTDRISGDFDKLNHRTYSLITISNGGRFLLVPENAEVPSNLPPETCVLKLPLDKTYLVSSSAMDYVAKLGAVGSLRFSGTKESGWFIPEARDAMKAKKLLYAGKYSAPDYEILLSLGCNFALENTMIYHNPEVKEKLEELGIPVLVERSGYEADPLGRLEWIKLYGLLFGKESEAQEYFESEIKKIETVLQKNQNGGADLKNQKSVAFFFVNSNGAVNVRKGGDYISKMIEIAGGKYVPQDEKKSDGRKHVSTETVQFESFYAAAHDADILIYDGTIGGEISRKADLLRKNPLFAGFKAYKSGNIYCVGRDFFQRSTGTADFISDVSKAVSGEESGLVFLRKVK